MSSNGNATADTDEDFQGIMRAELTKIQHSQEQINQRLDSLQIDDLKNRVVDLEEIVKHIVEDPNMETHSPAGPSDSPSEGAGPSSDEENTSGTGVSEEPTSTNENSNQPVNQEPSAAAASPTRNHREDTFWTKLKELSNSSKNKEGLMKQWVYISTTKSRPIIDCCLCGGTKSKCLYHIKNVQTRELAQLAGNHIDHIKKKYDTCDLWGVLLTAKVMFEDRGVSGHLRAVDGDTCTCTFCTLQFEVNKHANIIKYRQKLTSMYPGGIPLVHVDEANRDRYFLIAKAECDKARSMTIDTEYTLWVKLYVDDKAPNFTLKAEVINAELKKNKNEKH